MCTSTSTTGHTFVDTDAPAYTDYNGQRRVWQECTGCGNVQNRLAPRCEHLNTDALPACDLEATHTVFDPTSDSAANGDLFCLRHALRHLTYLATHRPNEPVALAPVSR